MANGIGFIGRYDMDVIVGAQTLVDAKKNSYTGCGLRIYR